MRELGNCRICGKDAGVVYPLLPSSPAFCSDHHNPKDTAPWGCDFSGPDDFDIPIDEEYHYEVPGLAEGDPIWRTKEKKKVFLSEMTDSHIVNTLNYLNKREETMNGKVECGEFVDGDVYDFVYAWQDVFEKEIKKRKIKVKSFVD